GTNNHLDPVTPLQVLGPGHYYVITGFDEFVGLHPVGFPGLPEFLHDSPSLIKSEDAAPRTDCPREVQLEARSRVFHEGIRVLAVERVVPGLDDLHVLLRHRLRRMPQPQESSRPASAVGPMGAKAAARFM